MKLHSPFGPSSLERRALCSGSYLAEKDLPDTESEAAARGTELHAVLVKVLTRSLKENDDGTTGIAEFDALDEYDKGGVRFCHRVFNDSLVQFPEPPSLIFEREIDLQFIHSEIHHGTEDVAMYLPFERGHVIDFKMGLRQVTPAPDNIQLLVLAIGLAEEFDLERVKVTLCQPYTRHISHHEYTRAELDDKRKDVVAVVEKSLTSLERTAGDKQCAFCKAAGTCPELAGTAAQLPVKIEPNQLSREKLAEYLEKAELVETFIGALRKHAFAVLIQGGKIPGWVIGEGRKDRDWNDVEVEKALLDLAKRLKKDPEAIYQKKLSSPAQIEEAWGKAKKVGDALAPLIIRKPGKQKLMREEK